MTDPQSHPVWTDFPFKDKLPADIAAHRLEMVDGRFIVDFVQGERCVSGIFSPADLAALSFELSVQPMLDFLASGR